MPTPLTTEHIQWTVAHSTMYSEPICLLSILVGKLFFQTTVQTSKIRKDGKLQDFCGIPNPNKYGKHLTCYKAYTNSCILNKLQKPNAACGSNEGRDANDCTEMGKFWSYLFRGDAEIRAKSSDRTSDNVLYITISMALLMVSFLMVKTVLKKILLK